MRGREDADELQVASKPLARLHVEAVVKRLLLPLLFLLVVAPVADARVRVLHSVPFAQGVVSGSDQGSWVELKPATVGGIPGYFNVDTGRSWAPRADCAPFQLFRLVAPGQLLNACDGGVTQVTDLARGTSVSVPGQGDELLLHDFCRTVAIGTVAIEKVCSGQDESARPSRAFYLRSAPETQVTTSAGRADAIDLDSPTLTTPMCSPLRIGPAFANGWGNYGEQPFTRVSQYLPPYGLKASPGVALYGCGSKRRLVLCKNTEDCEGATLLPGLVVWSKNLRDYVYDLRTRRTYRLAAPANYLTAHAAYVNYGSSTRVIPLP